MPNFPHLVLRRKLEGNYRAARTPFERTINPTTQLNLDRRAEHGRALLNQIDQLQKNWQINLDERRRENLPWINGEEAIPVFLQIDPVEFNIESLKGFGIEIISEEEDGYIIGASSDNFSSLRGKIELFLRNESGKNHKDKAAQLWQINDGINWKLERILSEDLTAKWDRIGDDEILIVDISIACYIRVSDQPTKSEEMTEEHYQGVLTRWERRKQQSQIKRDELLIQRQEYLETIISGYGGELKSGYVEYADSFCCRLQINGKGLKDLVLTYPYLFEVVEYDPFTYSDGQEGGDGEITTEVIPPDASATSVCIIDSGIQEAHRLIQPAIKSHRSKSYISSDGSVADSMPNGGHGTRVAGSVLYPRTIPKSGRIQLHAFIENARILKYDSGRVIIPSELYPPELMQRILTDFDGTRLFNLSINSYSPCRMTHMSQWASSIDMLMYENDVLFIISAGNIAKQTGSTQNPGIKEYLDSGRNYPSYLLQKSSRIGSPAQSCFALTVGSICIGEYEDDDKISLGRLNYPSSFSRTGLGIWNMIKPDVVEYGGDFLRTKTTPVLITNESTITPETIRSTTGGISAIGQDSVGTSFSTPKVAHIAAALENAFPSESANLYRALIVQSARLPLDKYRNPTIDDIRCFGYGIPDIIRATENTETRITFYTTDSVKPKQTCLYSVNIPSELRRPGEEYDILVEVTLAYMAEPRRTRRRTNSYLSQWLSWDSSKFNESFEQFSSRVVQNIELPDDSTDDQNAIKWVIREKSNWSRVPGIKRQDSTLQKSWCIIKSYDLPETLSFAVAGHKGWDSDQNVDVDFSFAVSFEALDSDINLYEMISVENQIQQAVLVRG